MADSRSAGKAAYRGKFLTIEVERIRLPNGEHCDLELFRHPGAAAVVPLTDRGEIILVRQYRYATGGWLLEIPAGKRDDAEDPLTCAARELEEETGYRAHSFTPLGWIWTTPGFCDERIWLYCATGLTATEQRLERDEVLELERLPLDRAVAMAYSGEITDGKTICAVLRTARASPSE